MCKCLTISKLTSVNELDGFVCGIAEIDNIIIEYLPDIIRKGSSNVYVVREKSCEDVLSVFALSKTEVCLDTYDIRELHDDYSDIEDEDVKYEYFPAMEIDLLAVRDKYRNSHIGKKIIETIRNRFENFGFGDCLFVVVDAYYKKGYTAVPFYERCGFRMIGQFPTVDTIRMFRSIE